MVKSPRPGDPRSRETRSADRGGRPLTRQREYDEDDVRVRPGRAARPRTKKRPAHADAVSARVVAVDRGRYTCVREGQRITAMAARELGRKTIVVGDRVRLVGDTSAGPDALARVIGVEPRESVLRRTADDDDPYERVIVANADQMVIVMALADPPPRTGLIDRCLVAALEAGISPLLCLTKADLAGPEEVLGYYADLDLDYVLCQPEAPTETLRDRLHDRFSVFVGHSGVGKSTLVNRLIPDAARSVGTVSAIGRGRHTSTSVVALELPDGGWLADTPGIRSFGLAHVSPADLLRGFSDLAEGALRCPPGCAHTGDADRCALDEWVKNGHATQARLASYRRLLDSRGEPQTRSTTGR